VKLMRYFVCDSLLAFPALQVSHHFFLIIRGQKLLAA